MRPWAVRVFDEPPELGAAADVLGDRSSTSAAFVPASRWSIATSAICSASSVVHALATTWSASSSGTPSCSSGRTRRNSVFDGSTALSIVTLSAPIVEWPVRVGACDHVEVVGELFFERFAHLPDLARHDVARHERGQKADEEAPQGLEDDRGHYRPEDSADDRPAGDGECREAEAGELDVRHEALPPALAADGALRGVREHRGDLGAAQAGLLLARDGHVLRHAAPERAVADVDRGEDRERDKREHRDHHEDHQPWRRDHLVDPGLLERALRREIELRSRVLRGRRREALDRDQDGRGDMGREQRPNT